MSIDAAIEAAVVKAVHTALAPYLRRLADPDPLVYSVPDTAKVLCTSETTVRRLVERKLLPTVPHIPGRVLIPRVAVARFAEQSAAASGNTKGRQLEAEPAGDVTAMTA